jgi:pimeloyl-ACP methyl ester carboxylesterase
MWKKSVAQTSASPVKNIVLVHGAWVDGSGWKPVYDILTKDGYTVTLVQEPLTSFAEDVRATKRVLDQQRGPCILVGHSYGGSVITEAGTDSHVVGLVYIAAHMPDTGESEATDGLHSAVGLRREDVFISLVEVKKENWSFGNGIAQYAV